MKFSEAMKLLEDGKKVRLKSWVEKKEYIYKDKKGYISDRDDISFNLTLYVDGEWEEYIEGPDINAATKIEEITNTFIPKDGTDYAIKENFTIIFNKLNEVIRAVNRRNENERI